jgi:hypothetical protein
LTNVRSGDYMAFGMESSYLAVFDKANGALVCVLAWIPLIPEDTRDPG